ncbi:MAG: hypothetical protein LUC92_00805 [Clostridiales bacterium]|nr:hypothetical protein [Clostridiales bacterium]
MNNTQVNEEVLSLISDQIDDINEETEYYTKLLEKLIDSEDKSILRDIILSKKKHLCILKDMVYRLKGSRPIDTEPKQTEAPASNFPSEFKKAALKELSNSEIYRSLVFDFLNQSIRDSFTEIMTDCQNNSLKLSVLLTKYS